MYNNICDYNTSITQKYKIILYKLYVNIIHFVISWILFFSPLKLWDNEVPLYLGILCVSLITAS